MDILNKGERTIGEIKPLEVVKLKKEEGDKLLAMYPDELVLASDAPVTADVEELTQLVKVAEDELKASNAKVKELEKSLKEANAKIKELSK